MTDKALSNLTQASTGDTGDLLYLVVDGNSRRIDLSDLRASLFGFGTSDYLDLAEIAAPSAPSANVARLYAIDQSGLTRLSYTDSAGTARRVMTGGVTGDSSLAANIFTQDNNGERFEILKDGSALNYSGTRASFVLQHRDTASIASDGIIPGAVFQFAWTGDGSVTAGSDTSFSIHYGLYSYALKSGDGSGHCFTGIGELGAYGAGTYNELGGFVGTFTNTGSVHGTIAGVEVLVQDGTAGNNYDTKLHGVTGRIARFNAGSRLSAAFLASSEGSASVDAVLSVNATGTQPFKRGIDLREATFSDGISGAFSNNTSLSWMNAAGSSLLPILFLSAADEVFLSGASTTAALRFTNSAFADAFKVVPVSGPTGNLQANASASAQPSLSAVGSETNIDIVLTAKGTGGVIGTFTNTGLRAWDTNASHYLIVAPGSDLTDNRTFTITTGDANRTLDISAASVTISSFAATVLDDTTAAAAATTLGLGTGDSPQFTAVNLNHATANTLTASGGHMTIEGATVWDSVNDGAGSGLDADLLDGKNTGTSGNVVPLLDGTNTWSGQQTISLGSAAPSLPLRLVNTADNASVQIAQLEGDRATMADNDEAYVSLLLSDDGGTQTEFARLTWVATDVNAGTSVDGRIDFAVVTAGSLADEMQLDGTALAPSTSAGLGLGTSSLKWKNCHVRDAVNIGAASGLSVDPGFYVTSTFPQTWQFNVSNANGKIYFYDATNNKFPILFEPNSPDNAFYMAAAAGLLIGDTTNAGMTLGITINQGAADNEILAFKSSDVAHGVTSLTETDTYGYAKKASATGGGLQMVGVAEDATVIGLHLIAVGDTTTEKTTAATAMLVLDGQMNDGDSIPATNATANSNLMAVRDNTTTRFILDSDGDSHQDVGTAWTNFDDLDDVDTLNALAFNVARPSDPIREKFGKWMAEKRSQLEAARLVTFADDGHHFVNMSRLTMLHTGAIRQLGERFIEKDGRIAALEARLAAIEHLHTTH